MKKLSIILLLLLGIHHITMAQKYLTRTGKVSFFSSTPLEDIEAINNDVSSVMDAKTNEILFIVPIKSFKFEKALMEQHFNENYMESDDYPKATFTGKIADNKTLNFKKDGLYAVTVEGKLTIHGVSKQVAIPATIQVDKDLITSNAKFIVRPADYSIRIPGIVAGKIAEEIEVTINAILNKK